MSSPNSDRIQKRAYEIWEREGRPHGRDEHHWHVAAREIEREDSAAPGAASAKQKPAKGSGAEQPRSNADARLSDGPATAAPDAPAAAAKPKRTPKPKPKK